MKFVAGMALAAVLVLTGFAAGFSFGTTDGFERGGEWALVQADVLARESGVFMPVSLHNGTFRVVIQQPRGLYKRAWKLSDQYDGKQQVNLLNPSSEQTPAGTVAFLVK